MDVFTVAWAEATQKGVIAYLPNTLIQEDKRQHCANNNEWRSHKHAHVWRLRIPDYQVCEKIILENNNNNENDWGGDFRSGRWPGALVFVHWIEQGYVE
jgi:hypothetical protein